MGRKEKKAKEPTATGAPVKSLEKPRNPYQSTTSQDKIPDSPLSGREVVGLGDLASWRVAGVREGPPTPYRKAVQLPPPLPPPPHPPHPHYEPVSCPG